MSKSEDNRKPDNFDWMSPVWAHNPQNVFGALKTAVQADIEKAKTLDVRMDGGRPELTFRVNSDTQFIAVSNAQFESQAYARFNLQDSGIQIEYGENKGETRQLSIVPFVNHEGENTYTATGLTGVTALQFWQIRRIALQPVIFRNFASGPMPTPHTIPPEK
jgi:hypothetical protein